MGINSEALGRVRGPGRDGPRLQLLGPTPPKNRVEAEAWPGVGLRRLCGLSAHGGGLGSRCLSAMQTTHLEPRRLLPGEEQLKGRVPGRNGASARAWPPSTSLLCPSWEPDTRGPPRGHVRGGQSAGSATWPASPGASAAHRLPDQPRGFSFLPATQFIRRSGDKPPLRLHKHRRASDAR